MDRPIYRQGDNHAFTYPNPAGRTYRQELVNIAPSLSNLFLISSKKRIYSKQKEFAPTERKFFPISIDPFSEGT